MAVSGGIDAADHRSGRPRRLAGFENSLAEG
jgi:hypothetical protein